MTFVPVPAEASTPTTRQLRKAQAEFENKVSSLAISPQTIITILQYAMEAVELTTLRGDEKRSGVIQLVRQTVALAPVDDAIQAVLVKMLDDGIVEHIIEIVVAASRGKLNLNAATGAGRVICTGLATGCIPRCLAD